MRDLLNIITESLLAEDKPLAQEPEELAADSDGGDVLPITDDDIRAASMPDKVRNKLFKNRETPEGTLVAVRLNLNTRIMKGDQKYSIQTVHSRGRPDGAPIGYDSAVTLSNCTFYVNQTARAAIATKREAKSPMAAVVGMLTHKKPRLAGIEVRFNPFNTHLFIRADDGRAIKTADEVTIFGDRCYVRGNVTYWDSKSAPKPKEGVPSNARFHDAD